MNLSLKQKLILIPLLTALVVFLISFAYIVNRLQEKSIKDAEQIVKNKTQLTVNKIESILNNHLGVINGISISLSNVKSIDNNINYTHKVFNEVLQKNPNYVNAWCSYELNKYDKNWGNFPGRIIICSNKDEKNIKNGLDTADIDGVKKKLNYHIMQQKPTEQIYEPYYKSIFKDTNSITTLSSPIIKNNQFIGAVGMDMKFDELRNILTNLDIFENGYAFLLSNEGRYVFHPDNKYWGETFSDVNPAEDSIYHISAKIKKGISLDFYATHTDTKNAIYVVFLPINIGKTKTPWSLGVLVHMNQVRSESRTIITNTIIVGIIGFLVIFIILFLTTRSILNSLNNNIAFATKISKGDLSSQIDIKNNDEIGRLGQGLQRMSIRLNQIVNELKTNAQNIDDFSASLTANADNFLELAKKQKQSSGDVSLSISEIAQNIKVASTNAGSTKAISAAASEKLKQGSKMTTDTFQSISAISETIKDIVQIADKTDLLAINASIEANRAGEFGKSFGIVAAEVRKLAENSQKAAIQITDLSGKSEKISEESGNIVAKLVPDMQAIVDLVEEIALLSNEQNDSIERIKHAMEELNQLSSVNSDFANYLSDQVKKLKKMSSRFKEIVAFFKT